MKILFLLSLIIHSLFFVNGQEIVFTNPDADVIENFYLTRNKIRFYIDDTLLNKEQSDSIIVFIKKGNSIIHLEDSISFGIDSSEISVFFVLFDRVMEFHDIGIPIFTKNVEYFEFGYIHIDKFIPLTKENVKNTKFEEYVGKYAENRFFTPLKKEIWDFPALSINNKKIYKEDVLYGAAYFTYSLTEFSLSYLDFIQKKAYSQDQ
jgi:hypothetical protein